MQSGYGEIQQFMVDGSLFSPPNPNPNPNAGVSADIQQKFYHMVHPQQQHHHHHQHPHPQIHQPHPHHHPTMSPQFSHLVHPIPITQQLFHHPHHQFQLFHPPPPQHPHHHGHGLGMDQVESAPQPENPNSPPGPSFLASAMSFKLGVNESSSGGNDDDVMLHGDDHGSHESRLHSWHREEDQQDSAAAAATIKEPFWRRPFDIDYSNRNNKRPLKDKSPEEDDTTDNGTDNPNYSKKMKEIGLMIIAENNQANQENAAADSNYKQLFSELEAIYKPGSGGSTPNNQTGSGSALTGDENPILPDTVPGPTATDINNEHRCSDTSDGGDAPVPMTKKSSHNGRKQRARRRQQEQLRSVAAFIESLVNQVMTHQESLHQKFLDVMERRDKERSTRDEAWRNQEAARSLTEASARAQDRAHAANREAAIVSFLEKITGERIDLPVPLRFLEVDHQPHKDDDEDQADCNNTLDIYNAELVTGGTTNVVQLSTSRWPKAEVQALIRVRSGFESRFQEPGLKGPLWEEVSATMGAMGYFRNAKRCKEKWENINKYFRKTKDSGKKRPEHSKTCPYFQQLDQLYSKSSTPPLIMSTEKERKDVNSELLDAIVVSNTNVNEEQLVGKIEEEERDGELEGEGDSQDHHIEQEAIEESDHRNEEDPQDDTTFFFQRLRS